MPRYLIFRNVGNNLQYQGHVDDNSPEEAVQTWLDQSYNPPKIEASKKLKGSDYIAVKASDTFGYHIKRR